MSDIFLKDYGTNWSEKLTFFALPVYRDRHYDECLQAKTWRGRSIHFALAVLESTMVFGALIALVEAAVAAFWLALKDDGALKGWDDVLANPQEEDRADQDEEPAFRSLEKSVQIAEKLVAPSTPLIETHCDSNFDIELPVFPEIIETAKERKIRRKAAAAILSTPGFEMEPGDRQTHYGYKGEVQGTAALRFATAKATRDMPNAISPASLREQREINLEQYLILKLKRFGHALGLKGILTLPSGKQFNLEGFCEAFTVPMIASSFQSFASENRFFTDEDHEWIVENFNQTSSSDYTEPDDIQVFATQIQDPNFRGPIALGTGHHWHSTGTIFYGNYLIFCNRGWGDHEPGIHVYYLPDRSLITEGVIWEMTKRQEVFGGDSFGLSRIVSDLGGQLVHYEKMSSQEAGNCTYISMETSLYCFMVMKQLMNFYSEEGEAPHLYTDPLIWEQAFATLRPVFEEWVAFDRELVFNDTMNEIQEWLSEKTPFSLHNFHDLYESLLITWRNHKHICHFGDSKQIKQILDAFEI